MPNWCEGILRVKGKTENIVKMVIECLVPVDLFGNTIGSLKNDGGIIGTSHNVGSKEHTEGLQKHLNCGLMTMKNSALHWKQNLHGTFPQKSCLLFRSSMNLISAFMLLKPEWSLTEI